MLTQSLRNHSHHLDKRLRFRLRLYFIISILLMGVFIYNIAHGALRIDYGILGLLAGVGLGIVSSRMFHTSWDHDAKKVVSRLDVYGVIILVGYILIEIMRDRIVGYFTHDVQVGTIGFAVLAGIMFGRVLGTRGKIIQILKEQEVFG